MKETIAFFGLGAMGQPMTVNLLKAGYRVITAVEHPEEHPRSLAAAHALGAVREYDFHLADTQAQAMAQADFVITMLPADREVREVLLNPRALAAVRTDTVIIDMSSCTSGCIRGVAAEYEKRGVAVVDAPVSGGTNGAADGTLTIFAAGEEDALEKAGPVFEVLGARTFHLGACGNGKTMKNLNNLMSASNVVIISEVYRIAKKENLDMDRFFEVVMASSGYSASFKNRFHRMVQGSFEGGFSQALARKDVGNALAQGDGIPTPVTRLVYELLLANQKYDKLDMAVISRLFED